MQRGSWRQREGEVSHGRICPIDLRVALPGSHVMPGNGQMVECRVPYTKSNQADVQTTEIIACNMLQCYKSPSAGYRCLQVLTLNNCGLFSRSVINIIQSPRSCIHMCYNIPAATCLQVLTSNNYGSFYRNVIKIIKSPDRCQHQTIMWENNKHLCHVPTLANINF